MRARALEEAKEEISAAIDYYSRISERLATRFKRAVDRALVDVIERPNEFPILDGEYRRNRIKKFPYGIVYRIDAGEVVITAFMHLHREPGYWKGRD